VRCDKFRSFRRISEERFLLFDDESVALLPKDFDIFLVSVRRDGGHLVKKDVLSEQFWADSFVEEATPASDI
jgi:hypothetical protein